MALTYPAAYCGNLMQMNGFIRHTTLLQWLYASCTLTNRMIYITKFHS